MSAARRSGVLKGAKWLYGNYGRHRADITYIPIGRGFLYLVTIMDWANYNDEENSR